MARKFLFTCVSLLLVLPPSMTDPALGHYAPAAPTPGHYAPAAPTPGHYAPAASTPASPPLTPAGSAEGTSEEPPEGYYAFVESPNATPPRVRPPPYRQTETECSSARDPRPHVTASNLCGDLNRGVIPRNPMGQNPNGEPYPFEIIRNQTLRFLSRTLPVLRADDTLPRVAHIQPDTHHNTLDGESGDRDKRSLPVEGDSARLPREHRGESTTDEEARESRKFCDGGGVFCMLYKAINGDSASPSGVERREDPGPSHAHQPAPRYEGPPTPCPARVEYATPVFARNYQGVWRYVVQIPYEGYFTQTIEVTRCMQSRCHYLEGGCLSSPRWVSLLVAELHYPDVLLAPEATPASPATSSADAPPSLNNFQNYQQYLQKRAGQSWQGSGTPATTAAKEDKPVHCDGHDDLGCFQVRLYYDWFLVPGSCKCWRPDYFARYVRRNSHTTEL